MYKCICYFSQFIIAVCVTNELSENTELLAKNLYRAYILPEEENKMQLVRKNEHYNDTKCVHVIVRTK